MNASTQSWRHRLYVIIFEADTPAGKAFDVALIIAILASVSAVMLATVAGVRDEYGSLLHNAEWAFTILFTIEYILRLATVPQPLRYARSFYGIVDLLAILPTYASALIPGAQSMLVVRVLRILRIFRVLKLAHHIKEAEVLSRALYASRRKITVFLFTVFTLVVILGSFMYIIEGEENGFTSIPRGVYWAIITLTTVGYGNVTPQTPMGQLLAAVIMIMGYGIIAVPTGIMTVELATAVRTSPKACPHCNATGHEHAALHCKDCGGRLDASAAEE